MARSFNGSSDFISTPKSVSGYGITTAFTIHVLFFPNNSSTMFMLGDNDGSIGNPGIELNQTSGSPTLFTVRSTTGGGAVLASGGTVVGSVWNAIAGRYDGANLTVWGNGSSVGSTAQTGTVINTTQALNIGQRGVLGSFWNGNLAEIALWSVPLSATEIEALARGVRANQIRPGSIKVWWTLDGYGHPALERIRAANGVLTGTKLVPSPTLISAAPIQISTLKFSASSSGTVKFRRSLSSVGTRTGSRQSVSF